MTATAKRIRVRRGFVDAERRFDIAFHTSNIQKFLQARTVFQRSGLNLLYFRHHQEPYSEDYSGSKRELLAKAVKEIEPIAGKASLFFVEDTSLRISALSTHSGDFPGLRVKEWFESTNFLELDRELRAKGRDRGAVVKSDIALHVPGLVKPLYFSGQTRGVVAESPPEFPPNPVHPWLTPSTFDGWMVPDGASQRLGEMSLEEALGQHFRVRAFVSLIDRLEEYAAFLNLPSQAYTRVRRNQPATGQLSLMTSAPPIYVILGRSCAGKTTFGEYAEQRYEFRFIEASNVMRMLGEEYEEENLSPDALARRVTDSQGPDVIALEAMRQAQDSRKGAVITGFRFIEEVEAIRNQIPTARIIWVDASERTRFERGLRRRRSEDSSDLPAFRAREGRQVVFGLLDVGDELADVVLVNEGSLDDFHLQVDSVLAGPTLGPGVVSPRTRDLDRSQLVRCLRILDSAGRALSCDQIERATDEEGTRIRRNNANKILKRYPALVRRFDSELSRVRYELTEAGRAYLRLIDRPVARPSIGRLGDGV